MPQQLSEEDLARAYGECDRPDLLGELIGTAARVFGVHTRNYPYIFNYPWVAARLESLSAGAAVLEIGAGANPLPLYFSGRGLTVDAIDNADFTRTLPAGEDWNEWGYFDYGAIDPAITSRNVSVAEFEPRHLYDAIYSVSVLALMPRLVREDTLRRCRDWLKPGGLLLLAIDLIPGTDSLWNKGGSNETPKEHGTYHDVEDQLRGSGFRITESRIMRGVWKARTDLHFLAAEL
jgi:SAM-dependent methyltransferase